MSIGGYFELELPRGEEYHKNAIRLNTGRNAFEYILRAKKYKKIYLPYYTCDVMLEPIKKLNLDYEFYHIDTIFQPVFDFNLIIQDEAFVYNNYFGICDEQVKEVAKKCKNLIIDNSQAFYAKPIPGVDTFYSPRKFFGLPDGAYLYTDTFLDFELEQDISFERCSHLLGRIDSGAEAHFHVYKENSKSLCNQPIREMSNLTHKLLSSINYNTVADFRRQNFNYLHSKLKKRTKLKFEFDKSGVPMVYPFLVENGVSLKKELINKKIFVATYWPNVLDWSNEDSLERNLAKNLIPIPCDQRQNSYSLNEIIKLII